MDNQIFNTILPYLSLGMLTVFAVFVVLGMLYGLGRGAKRSGIRLATFVIFLLIAFLITPFIVNAVLGLDVQNAGQTPQAHVNELSDRLVEYLRQQFGDYVNSFEDYIKEYALGIVIAGLNLVIFFAMFFIVKIVSWFIYAIIAHFAAPKRDHEGNRLPKHAGFGLLIGAVQGVVLFFFFMFPLNGIVSVVNHAAEYETMQAQSSEQQQVETQSVSGGHHAGSTGSGNIDINALVQKVGEPLKMYNNFMKYTGLQYLSDKAFEYQLTIRIEGADDINLVHDISSGFELYVDAQGFMDVVNKLQNVYSDGKIDLTALTTKDYQTLRNFINKAFDLQILNVANDLLGDLDNILSKPYNDNETKLAGTDIYENSIYGLVIKQNTTSRAFTYTLEPGETAPTNYAQLTKGLRSVVNYIGEQKLDLVRDDIINVIDFMEALSTYKVTYNGTTKKLSTVLAQGNLSMQDYFDLSTATLAEANGNGRVGDYLINVLGGRLINFSTVKMLGLANIDNLLIYSKAMDNAFSEDVHLKNLVDGLIPLFLGENALTHTDSLGHKVPGNWEKMGSDLLQVAHVLRDYVTIVDDINVKKQKFIEQDTVTTDEDEKASKAQMKAILEYLSELVDNNQPNKYQKIDDLVDALYKIIDDFAPVKDKEVYVKIVAYENFKELFLCERAIFTSRGWELLDSEYNEFEVKEWAFCQKGANDGSD